MKTGTSRLGWGVLAGLGTFVGCVILIIFWNMLVVEQLDPGAVKTALLIGPVLAAVWVTKTVAKRVAYGKPPSLE